MFARRVDALLTSTLLARHGGAQDEVSTVAWVLVRTVEGLTVGYVLEQPPITREAFADEVARAGPGLPGPDGRVSRTAA